jgi:hypothetical protein
VCESVRRHGYGYVSKPDVYQLMGKKMFCPHPQPRHTVISNAQATNSPHLFPSHQSPAQKSHIKVAKPNCSTYLHSPLSHLAAAAACLASRELSVALPRSHSTTPAVPLARKFQIKSRTPSSCSHTHACSVRSRSRAALSPSCSHACSMRASLNTRP